MANSKYTKKKKKILFETQIALEASLLIFEIKETRISKITGIILKCDKPIATRHLVKMLLHGYNGWEKQNR